MATPLSQREESIREEKIQDLESRAGARIKEIMVSWNTLGALMPLLNLPFETVFQRYSPAEDTQAWISGGIQYLRSVRGTLEVLGRISARDDQMLVDPRDGSGERLRDPKMSPSIFDEVWKDRNAVVVLSAGVPAEIQHVAANLRYWLGIEAPKPVVADATIAAAWNKPVPTPEIPAPIMSQEAN